MDNIYKLVDKIYCINLISRNDKYELMKIFQKNENIDIKYYRPIKDPSGGGIGCFRSHVEVIKDAYKNNYSNIIIFEDDVIRSKSYNSINYEEISNFIKYNKDWEIINLAPTSVITFFDDNISEHIFNGGTLSTFSYMLNKKGMEKIINTYEKFINDYYYDVYLQKIFLKDKFYNITPIIFNVNWNLGSDNNWCDNKIISSWIFTLYHKIDIIYILSLFKYNIKFIKLFLLFVVIFFVIFINHLYK
jgi:GR25 family glycosyltransferase involved in LPS biosynthesis